MGRIAETGAMDAPARGVERFRVVRIRFSVRNPGDLPLALTPQLEVGAGSVPGVFVIVPPGDPQPGAPFYVAGEPHATPSEGVGAIPVDSLHAEADAGAPGTLSPGARYRAVDPGPPLVVPAGARTEVEFSVRATADAAWLAVYLFRLSDAGAPLDGAAAATVALRSRPTIQLSPGQYAGLEVATETPRYGLVGPLLQDGIASGALVPLTWYELEAPVSFTSPHGDYTLTSDACAACHLTHTAPGRSGLAVASQASQCFACHDGLGALADVRAAYEDGDVPANDPANSAFYAHPATTDAGHRSDLENEFGGVLERHSACADCHDPHASSAASAVQTADGWSASGSLTDVSGVEVAYAPGSPPAYTRTVAVTFEYQLCFKCHSGWTVLRAQDPDHPSRWALDKAVELNTGTASAHPIEGVGTNTTAAMTASLSLLGTSPYKLWAFRTDSTIRCLNCHGDSRLADPDDPPAADAQLAPHANAYRGILMAPYRDRVLKSAVADYEEADFALCYQCHAESPFVDVSGSPNEYTNFPFHGLHVSGLAGDPGAGGVGTDIDASGAGQGNAICAECHYRIHGTAFAYRADERANPRLISFAPNVQPADGVLADGVLVDGVLSWTPAGGTPGSCTLTCHGKVHDALTYPRPP
jgi:predicted CXXCH cytochrome family protein